MCTARPAVRAQAGREGGEEARRAEAIGGGWRWEIYATWRGREGRIDGRIEGSIERVRMRGRMELVEYSISSEIRIHYFHKIVI